MQPGIARVADDGDFLALKQLLAADDGWRLEYSRNGVRVWTEANVVSGGLKTVRVAAEFADVTPEALYDVLHDPDYRPLWDTHMVAAEDAGYLNINNDVGYYAMSCPPPLKNRDFVLQRSWLDTGAEKMILNHSVCHKDFPPRKGFVRATSILTGYAVRAWAGEGAAAGGCWLGYVTRCDPRGQLPAWLVNKVTNIFAPKLVKRLHRAARDYPAWKASQPLPYHKPWLYPEQVCSERISVLDCVDPEKVAKDGGALNKSVEKLSLQGESKQKSGEGKLKSAEGKSETGHKFRRRFSRSLTLRRDKDGD